MLQKHFGQPRSGSYRPFVDAARDPVIIWPRLPEVLLKEGAEGAKPEEILSQIVALASPEKRIRAIRTIRAHICASRSAAISPIPEEPPVMTTVLPLIRNLPIGSDANQLRARRATERRVLCR
jgi:hypothetical protein